MIKKVINYIYILVLIIVIIAYAGDLVQVIVNPEDYRISQGFSEVQLKWNSPSVLEYIRNEILSLILLLFFLFIGFLNLKRGNDKLIRTAYYVSLVIFLVIVFYAYTSWSQTGFDH